jgi:hypothetical protein
MYRTVRGKFRLESSSKNMHGAKKDIRMQLKQMCRAKTNAWTQGARIDTRSKERHWQPRKIQAAKTDL